MAGRPPRPLGNTAAIKIRAMSAITDYKGRSAIEQYLGTAKPAVGDTAAPGSGSRWPLPIYLGLLAILTFAFRAAAAVAARWHADGLSWWAT